ncbi:MAG TPA: hypothetical protein VFF81_00160 [Noviherbaspirillum sp.]|nr:hypothetical protein [Noviherbaspirillum sp.]
METEVAKLAAAEARLRDVIRLIVKRRIAHNESLNWRLMFDIEDEAISLLERDADLDVRYLNMMASPSAQRRPCLQPSEETDSLTEVYPMHTALWMIQEAYHHEH